VRPRSIRPITPPIAARWLNVTPKTVCRWIRSGHLPAMNIGTRGKAARFRIYRKDLVTFMQTRGWPPETVQAVVKF